MFRSIEESVANIQRIWADKSLSFEEQTEMVKMECTYQRTCPDVTNDGKMSILDLQIGKNALLNPSEKPAIIPIQNGIPLSGLTKVLIPIPCDLNITGEETGKKMTFNRPTKIIYMHKYRVSKSPDTNIYLACAKNSLVDDVESIDPAQHGFRLGHAKGLLINNLRSEVMSVKFSAMKLTENWDEDTEDVIIQKSVFRGRFDVGPQNKSTTRKVRRILSIGNEFHAKDFTGYLNEITCEDFVDMDSVYDLTQRVGNIDVYSVHDEATCVVKKVEIVRPTYIIRKGQQFNRVDGSKKGLVVITNPKVVEKP